MVLAILTGWTLTSERNHTAGLQDGRKQSDFELMWVRSGPTGLICGPVVYDCATTTGERSVSAHHYGHLSWDPSVSVYQGTHSPPNPGG